MERAVTIASGCNATEVAVLHVYRLNPDYSYLPTGARVISKDDRDSYQKINEQIKLEGENIIEEAYNYLEAQGIKANKILKEGHPSHTIVETAREKGYDMIIVGNRGRSGIKRQILGSVSSAVVQEVQDGSVLVVK